MKKTFTHIITACLILGSLCGCSVSKTENANTTENITEQSGNSTAINPWVDLNEDAAMKVLTKSFKAPDGAGDVSCQTYQSDTPSETEVKYIQLSFTMNGTEFHARGYEGLLNWNDISGMYYNWTSTEDGKSTIWGKNNIAYQKSSYVGDDNDPNDSDAMLLEWYDADSLTMYSLSATGNDLNGVDLVAIAEMMNGEK